MEIYRKILAYKISRVVKNVYKLLLFLQCHYEMKFVSEML